VKIVRIRYGELLNRRKIFVYFGIGWKNLGWNSAQGIGGLGWHQTILLRGYQHPEWICRVLNAEMPSILKMTKRLSCLNVRESKH